MAKGCGLLCRGLSKCLEKLKQTPSYFTYTTTRQCMRFLAAFWALKFVLELAFWQAVPEC